MSLANPLWGAPRILLVRRLWGANYTDLGPFRAIRRDALEALDMTDRKFGWTVEMQIKAAITGVRSLEIPVSYRSRIGASKISGTLRGSFKAGVGILGVIARSSLAEEGHADRAKQDGVASMSRHQREPDSS